LSLQIIEGLVALKRSAN